MWKNVLTWLADPYLHLIAIALVLFRLAATAPSESDVEPVSIASFCRDCKAMHNSDYSCPMKPSFLARLFPGESPAN